MQRKTLSSLLNVVNNAIFVAAWVLRMQTPWLFTHQGVSCGCKQRNLIYRLHTVRGDRSDIKSFKLNFFRDECIQWLRLHRHRLPTTLYFLVILFHRWTRGWNRERAGPTLTSRLPRSLFLCHRQYLWRLCVATPRARNTLSRPDYHYVRSTEAVSGRHDPSKFSTRPL